MKSTLYIPSNVEDALRKLRKSLENNGFIVSEEDATFDVKLSKGKVEKIKTWSQFWSRKDHLEDKYPRHYSIVIKGDIRAEEEGAVIDVELIEYHAGRPHSYGGTASIMEYFEKFCKIFQK